MSQPNFALDDVDFDAFYQGKPPLPDVEASFDVTPWDIDGPQPAVMALAETGKLTGPVLDAGCGLGNNAIFLAERGYQVTGVDGSQTALDTARQRAGEHGVDVEFVQADVTTLDGVAAERFGTVLDSALYHCLTDEQRHAYAAALHRVTVSGATLHLFCFADTGNDALPLPLSVSQQDLREHLGPLWNIHTIEPDDYATAMTPASMQRMSGALVDPADAAIDPAELRLDDSGHIVGRVWHLHAQRRDTADR